MSLLYLGMLHCVPQKKYQEAERLMKRALAIQEKATGFNPGERESILNSLAKLYLIQGKGVLAEPLYEQVLAMREARYGKDQPETVQALNHLALARLDRGRFPETEELGKRALRICEKSRGPDDPTCVPVLETLVELYRRTGNETERKKFELRMRKNNVTP
jgi:tetratricopeptide (TPR) repeat protein